MPTSSHLRILYYSNDGYILRKPKNSVKYTCSACGIVHDSWPALAFKAPYHYNVLSTDDRLLYAKELNEDFCVLEYEDQTNYFIRAVLFQKVVDHCEDLQYGVWVSLSEANFNNYNENFFFEVQEGTYFGYLCSQIDGYDNTLGIRTNVVLSGGRQRPEIFPHDDQMNIDFVRDFYNGISKSEAEKRIADLMKKQTSTK